MNQVWERLGSSTQTILSDLKITNVEQNENMLRKCSHNIRILTEFGAKALRPLITKDR
jgi:hypothetical protein